MKRALFFVLTIFLLNTALVAFAQENQEIKDPSQFPEPFITPSVHVNGTVDCFDYYKFGSVQVDVEPSVTSTVSGTMMNFDATIKNDNEYPIVDGAVYAKIFKKQSDQDKAHANGNDLVDQFFIKEDISLNAKESKLITFEWQVPSYATTGDYQIAMFFTSAKKFNLLGLTFTDDVLGNMADFSIIGEVNENVAFNKNTVDINGDNYHFAAYPPQFQDEDIDVKVQLVNTMSTEQMIPVTWKLYAWDGQLESNLRDTKEEMVALSPNETKEISFVIRAKEDPVYYLVAEAQYKDTKSILDIRTVRANVNKVRINFPSIANYPLKEGESNTLFVCTHNSGTAGIVENNKLIVTLLDENQKSIHSYKYEGQISGAMMGLKEDFTPKETYGTFFIKSELYTGEKLVDSVTMKYDCNVLDKSLCPVKGSLTDVVSNNGIQKAKYALGIIFFLIIVVTVGVVAVRRKNLISVLIMSCSVITGFLWHTNITYAASVIAHTDFDGDLGYQSTAKIWAGLWYPGLSDPSVDVRYQAMIYNADNNELISPNAKIPIGTRIRFEQKLGNISFNGTGTTWDTPLGTWKKDAAFPDSPIVNYSWASIALRAGQCSDKYLIKTITNDTVMKGQYNGIKIYIPLSVNPPIQSITRDAASKALLDCSGDICTVVSAGVINTNFVFASTYGYFYYEYDSSNSVIPGKCHLSWDVLPMRKCDIEQYIQDITEVMISQCKNNINENKDSGKIIIPSKTIAYNLTAVAAGSAPTTPTLTGPVTGLVNTGYDFIVNATDPDGDTLKYGFDWNNDNSIDQWMPASTYVASGKDGVANHQWAIVGSKAIRAKACDKNGNCSTWSAIHNIAITEYADGKCGTRKIEDPYPASTKDWPTGSTLCEKGIAEPASVAFPSAGASVSWICKGIGGGKDTNCTIAHAAQTYPCKNTKPSNAITCAGDNQLPTENNVSWKDVNDEIHCSNRKCEYYFQKGTVTSIEDDQQQNNNYIEGRP